MSGNRSSRGIDVRLRRAVGIGLALCVLLLLLDRLRLRHPDFHPHFEAEQWFGFYAGLSMIGCLILAAVTALFRMGRAAWASAEDDRT